MSRAPASGVYRLANTTTNYAAAPRPSYTIDLDEMPPSGSSGGLGGMSGSASSRPFMAPSDGPESHGAMLHPSVNQSNKPPASAHGSVRDDRVPRGARSSSAATSSAPMGAPADQAGADGAASGEGPSRVRVVVRVRPPIPEDRANSRTRDDLELGIRVHSSHKRLVLTRPLFESREFRADCVLGTDTSQETMYDAVARAVVDDVLNGFNGTVLAYGQTGSGKTYTVFGPEETVERSGDPNYFERCGVIPRAIDHIFERIDSLKESTEFRVSLSCLEIYMEFVMDLFDLSHNNMAVRQDPRLGVYVEEMTRIAVTSPFDALVLIQEAFKNRAISQTYMNKTSSRSHVVVFLVVEQRELPAREGAPPGEVKRGLLTIVDLAGSERVSKSGSDGQRLREAKQINRSLCALGNCVAALAERKASRHIPYRNSKLTRILTDSLGGNTKTCLVATVCPTVYNYEESSSTLLFASRAMAVVTDARVNIADAFYADGEVSAGADVGAEWDDDHDHGGGGGGGEDDDEYDEPRMHASSMHASMPLPAAAGGSRRPPSAARQPTSAFVATNASNERGPTPAGPPVPPSPGRHTSGARSADDREALRRELDQLRAQHAQLEAECDTLRQASVPRDRVEELWRRREHDLVSKFTAIIAHMQAELKRKTEMLARYEAAESGGATGKAAGGERTESEALEQLVSGLLSIPSLRVKLSERMSNHEA